MAHSRLGRGRCTGPAETPGRTISPFYLGASLIAQFPELNDYRARQTEVGTLVVEVGGRTDLNLDEQNTIISLLKKQTGDEFQVRLKVVPEIDWRESVKRLGFYNEV